jgi:DNA polymerase-3 subunit epsilon
MREIILDTETTGLSFKADRVIEIGAVEMIDWNLTGKAYHRYINPQREVSKEAFRVHGISTEFLKSKPVFKRLADRFLEFIGDARLVAHNANFDISMLNAELARIDYPPIQNEVVDTMQMARDVRAGGRHTLDALCSYYGIDGSRREKHGALLDAELLAQVYIELRGGRQMPMSLEVVEDKDLIIPPARQRPTPLPPRLTDEDRRLHTAFVAEMGEKAIWLEYQDAPLTTKAA